MWYQVCFKLTHWKNISVNNAKCVVGDQNSEDILCMKSLIKEDINSWDERVKYDSDNQHHKEEIIQQLGFSSNEIQESELCQDSCELAINRAGYITKNVFG